MKAIYNPHETVLQELSELKKLVIQIRDQPKEDYSLKFYTPLEISKLTKTSIQSIRSYIKKGWINDVKFGPRKNLINHYEIFNEDQTIKQFKYKRSLNESLDQSV